MENTGKEKLILGANRIGVTAVRTSAMSPCLILSINETSNAQATCNFESSSTQAKAQTARSELCLHTIYTIIVLDFATSIHGGPESGMVLY